MAPTLPATLAYQSTGPVNGSGTLTGSGPSYTAGFGGGDGVWTISASLNDAGASVTFTIDHTSPTLTVTVASPPLRGGPLAPVQDEDPGLFNAWKRDETAVVKVEANEPLPVPPSLTLAGMLRDGGVNAYDGGGIGPLPPTACCAGAPNCSCYSVQFAAQPFEAFRGAMRVLASGADRAGNVGFSASQPVSVTRWRWSTPAFPATEAPKSLVLDARGSVIVGSATTGQQAGTVASFSPAGQVQWTRLTYGAVTAAPIVGSPDAGGLIYLPARDAVGATLFNLRSTDGLPAPGAGTCGTGALDSIPAAMALARLTIGGLPGETVLAGRFSGSAVRFQGQRPFDLANACSPESNATNTQLRPEMGFSVIGSYVFHGNAFSHDLVQRDTTGLFGNAVNLGLDPRTLPIHLGASSVFGSGNNPTGTDGGIFQVQFGPTLAWHWPGAGPSVGTVGSLAIGAPADLYFGSSAGPLFNRLSETLAYRYTAPTIGLVSATPAVGAGGVIYAATNAGYVYAFDANLSELWVMPPPPFATFDSSPALDCGPRLADGGVNRGPGTLYLAGTGTGALYAIIVDSPGLDPAAPWPKFQRDTRNSGSTDTPVIASGTCQ